MLLREAVEARAADVPFLREIAARCLATRRWKGSVVCMLVDAAITSTGVNYFTVVVPRVEEFRRRFVETGEVVSTYDLASAEPARLMEIWRNRRSWRVAQQIARIFASIGDDRRALRTWAAGTTPENWRSDAVGRVKGVGINTFQYLRMMGGVDTAMPDRIVRRFINRLLTEAGEPPAEDDFELISRVEEVARAAGRGAVELCFLAWLAQFDDREKIKKYAEILRRI